VREITQLANSGTPPADRHVALVKRLTRSVQSKQTGVEI